MTPGEQFDSLGIDAVRIAVHAHQTGAAGAPPQRHSPVEQQGAAGCGAVRRPRRRQTHDSNAVKGLMRVTDPHCARQILTNIAIPAGL